MMAKNKFNISEDFCFSFKSGNIGTKITARKYFDEHKTEVENWWVQTSTIPIFIDTNFLLNAYSLPKTQRNLFVNFLRQNHDRIYITDQIDEEYQRKRPNFIKNYVNSVQTLFKELVSLRNSVDITKHCDDLVTKLENFKKRPIVQEDYITYLSNIEDTISRIREWKFATISPCSALNSDVDSYLSNLYGTLESEQKNIIEDTDLVEAVSLCKFCGNISQTEKHFVCNLYQSCVCEREEMKLRPDHIDLQMYTFPGLGDLSKEEEHKQREGDFLHYHEMLKQIKILEKNVIFLTSDVKKGDTATDKLEPFDHYICNCFHLTNHVYYLIDAKTLPLASLQIPVIDTDSDEEEEEIKEADFSFVGGNTPDIQESHKKKYFKVLTRDIFLEELSTCIKWSFEYGDKYVSKDYFIYGILGHKKFEFAKSKEMLQSLIVEGVIQIEKNEEDKDCIAMK